MAIHPLYRSYAVADASRQMIMSPRLDSLKEDLIQGKEIDISQIVQTGDDVVFFHSSMVNFLNYHPECCVAVGKLYQAILVADIPNTSMVDRLTYFTIGCFLFAGEVDSAIPLIRGLNFFDSRNVLASLQKELSHHTLYSVLNTLGQFLISSPA